MSLATGAVGASAMFLTVLLPWHLAFADPPTRERAVPLAHDLERFAEAAVSGGVPKDGIPAIDRPVFIGPEEADASLAPDDVVFGVVMEGAAKAYPRRVLAWHEIVNDRLGGEAISVTYCPLTGTTVGFKRGGTTFGVSGDLMNSNLIMYDRATESRWPQMLGTAVSGTMKGRSLEEFPVVWTTWEAWRAEHPETRVMSRQTGYARDYLRDPYGAYTPARDYYAAGEPIFPTLNTDVRLAPKDIVTGARNAHGAVAFEKEAMREEKTADLETGGMTFTAAYDPALDVVHIYENPQEIAFSYHGGAYHGGGESWGRGALPLDRANAFDSMWFAWAAFFPETALHD